MYIQTEDTPNPNALKFLPGTEISPAGPVFYNAPKEAIGQSDLAMKLFAIEGVEGVFYGYDFVTITKTDEHGWDVLKPEILMTLMDHLASGMPAIDSDGKANGSIDLENLDDVEKQIVEIIETRVRPSVAMDGGDVTYQGFKDGVVYLRLQGACSGCPSASITLKDGIESMLQHFVPEVKSVEAVEE